MRALLLGVLKLCVLPLLLAACGHEPSPEGGAPPPVPRGEIALTFDDAPTPDGPTFTGAERTERILAALAEAHVEGAIFFSTTHGLDRADGQARLRAYAAAGQLIGNHTASHANLAEVGAADFIADVHTADRILRTLPGFVPYFRYPHSQEGNTPEDRRAVGRALDEMGYTLGYFTVDAADWEVEELYEEALQKGQRVDLDELRRTYLEATEHAVDFYDHLAREVLHRSPRHVLILHETDLNALFLGDLLHALEDDGFTIIPALRAYADPLARQVPDNGRSQARITGLAMARGTPGVLENPWAWPDKMEELFAAAFLPVGSKR